MRIDANRRRLMRAAGALGLGSLAVLVEAQAQERHVRIVARKFEFEPRNIILKKGEPVVLELSSADVIMGFNVNHFGLRTDITPGHVSTLRLTPNTIGEFVFYCDVFCGNGHEEMDGTLTVIE